MRIPQMSQRMLMLMPLFQLLMMLLYVFHQMVYIVLSWEQHQLGWRREIYVWYLTREAERSATNMGYDINIWKTHACIIMLIRINIHNGMTAWSKTHNIRSWHNMMIDKHRHNTASTHDICTWYVLHAMQSYIWFWSDNNHFLCIQWLHSSLLIPYVEVDDVVLCHVLAALVCALVDGRYWCMIYEYDVWCMICFGVN